MLVPPSPAPPHSEAIKSAADCADEAARKIRQSPILLKSRNRKIRRNRIWPTCLFPFLKNTEKSLSSKSFELED